MGRITRYTKARAKKVPSAPMAKGKGVPDLPPPASEGEEPDAAPPAPPLQTSSTPKMVPGDVSTGLNMRKTIKD